MFVDVILPLPLEGLFTYTVPGDLADEIKPGMRVLVTLGRSKSYTAVVAEVHDRNQGDQWPSRPATDGA